MKIIRYEHQGVEQNGVLLPGGKDIFPFKHVAPDFSEISINELIIKFKDFDQEKVNGIISRYEKNALNEVEKSEIIPISNIIEKPLIPSPVHDVLCVGKNYQDHVLELKNHLDDEPEIPQGQELAEKAIYFGKRTLRILGDGESVVSRLDIDSELDYEAELAVIIGKEGSDIPREDAESYIFGYSIFNDVSSRVLQSTHSQWFKGKSLDTYAAMGPVIVTKDELPFPIHLDVECRVNGEVRQKSNTKLFLTDIPTIIYELSLGMALEPGDIIATGTPAGVGIGMKPPRFLKKGDVVECEIQGIGVLKNVID